MAADTAARAGNLNRLGREYRRTEHRAEALEKVLLPEMEDAIKRVDEQLDTMEREEIIGTTVALGSDGGVKFRTLLRHGRACPGHPRL